MSLAIYDRGFFFANGALLGESSGGSIEYQGDPIPVATLVKELAGFTPAPRSAMISVDSFVASAGFEFDAVGKFLKNEFITMKLQFGGSGIFMEADGMVLPPSITFSATDSTKLAFRVHVEAKPIE
jgi:hypothetical protein